MSGIVREEENGVLLSLEDSLDGFITLELHNSRESMFGNMGFKAINSEIGSSSKESSLS